MALGKGQVYNEADGVLGPPSCTDSSLSREFLQSSVFVKFAKVKMV